MGIYFIIVILFYLAIRKPFSNKPDIIDKLRILLMYVFSTFILLLILILTIVAIVFMINGKCICLIDV